MSNGLGASGGSCRLGEVTRSLWDIEGLNNYIPGVSAAGARTDPSRSAVPWWRQDAKWRIIPLTNDEAGENDDSRAR